ncbi:MAG: hypothetical protein ACXACC_00735 [Promethearchaeota archaeon]|jgi:ABC-type dipeptide/oligopeptide/nickel transport system permease component
MKNNKLSTYFLAKNISYEILIEEQLQLKSEATRRVLERFSKRKSSLKLKFVSYKFINSLIFGILPIFPLIAYLELSNFFVRAAVHIQIAIFTKSLIFQIFFTLQFLDFFLMGLFNLINIMSGEIFEWFKTLPLPKKKLKKLAFFTIIHNFDIPILANIFVFPIIMLFATQNVLIFLISLGTSLLNNVFSITVLIILGEKIAKRIKIQNVKAKKSLLFQLLNTLSYALIIFGSIFIVQMTLSSLVNILMTFLNLYNSPLYNLILSLIPFPFNPSYLISLFSSTSHITIQLWLNTLFGLALYLIVIYIFYRKSLKSLNNIISLKYKFNKNYLPEKIGKLKIRIRSVIKAFIRKDLLIISRNLQTFMGIIMPVIMSFVFITFFNISFVRGEDLLSGDLYYTWITLLGLSPLLSAMLVYNLLNMEASGKTIMGTLPISVRGHAKAKLVIMIIIQIIATLTPTLVYIFHYRFVDLLLTVLTTLPLVLNFLMFTFLLRVRLFGKKRYFHVLDEILPENKMSKWILILFLDYLIYFLIILISNYLYYNFDVVVSLLILFIISLSFMAILKVIFDNFFPKSKARTALKIEKPETEKIPSKIIIRRLVYTIAFVIYINFYFISIFLYQNFEISLLLVFIGIFLTLAKAVSKRVEQIGTKDKKLSIKKKEILKYIVNSFLKHFLIFFILITVFFFFFNEMYVSPLTPPPVQQLVADWNQLPLWERYLIYLKNLFTGNWEYSIAFFENREIKEKILADGAVSLTILIIPLCLRLLFAFKDGSLQNHKKKWKKFVGKAPLLGLAIPSFFLLLYMPFYFGFEVFSQLNYRILIAISILTITSFGRVAFIRSKNEFSPIDHINSALIQRKKHRKRKKSTLNPLKSLNFSNIFSISFLFGELIIIEKILFLTGWGFSWNFALSRSNFIEMTTIFFLFSLLIISISFIQSLFKLYLYIRIS